MAGQSANEKGSRKLWGFPWLKTKTEPELADVIELGISLLELNTFGHAVCTLVIYALWWHKPLDIEELELILIRDDECEEFVSKIMAVMFMASAVDPHVPSRRSESVMHFPMIFDKNSGACRVSSNRDKENGPIHENIHDDYELTIGTRPDLTPRGPDADTDNDDFGFLVLSPSMIHRVMVAEPQNRVALYKVMDQPPPEAIETPLPNEPESVSEYLDVPSGDLKRWKLAECIGHTDPKLPLIPGHPQGVVAARGYHLDRSVADASVLMGNLPAGLEKRPILYRPSHGAQ
ncbi:hypothetical protein B0H63DRAFT_507320 [Podospora didyma]|uniref:Uncharacterized protein n=1 Tax=Podospora didyma TaxID=330526 RepID=A0AAE0U426_9PEZI|nr:hypothetical protein B0H63DRAFT_507320 [Podospora didyma]